MHSATFLKNPCIKEVMLHYKSSLKLEFEIFQGSESYILRANSSILNQDLGKYLNTRRGIFESYHELLKFAKSTTCRLLSPRRYFLSSKSNEDFFCEQCDICEPKRLKKEVSHQLSV